MCFSANFFVNKQNLSVFTDVISPSERHGTVIINNTECTGDFFPGITADRVVEFQCFGIFRIGFNRIGAGSKESPVEFVKA